MPEYLLILLIFISIITGYGIGAVCAYFIAKLIVKIQEKIEEKGRK